MKKFVVLEHLTGYIGQRFWSQNSEDCERLNTGQKVYEKIMETDDPEEARRECANSGVSMYLSLEGISS